MSTQGKVISKAALIDVYCIKTICKFPHATYIAAITATVFLCLPYNYIFDKVINAFLYMFQSFSNAPASAFKGLKCTATRFIIKATMRETRLNKQFHISPQDRKGH